MAEFTSPIGKLLIVPDIFDAVSSELSDLWAKLGLSDVSETTTVPDRPGDTPDDSNDPFPDIEEGENADDQDVPEPQDADSTPTTDAASPLQEARRDLTLTLRALSEVEIGVPGIDGVKFVLNPGTFTASVTLTPDKASVSATLVVALRFSKTLLAPMRAIGGDANAGFEPDPTKDFVQIDLATVTLSASTDGTIGIDGGVGVALPQPAMVGTTGVIIETASIDFNLNGDPDHPENRPDPADPTWKGILIKKASIRVPSVFSGAIEATKLGFGSGGISGDIAKTFDNPDLNSRILGLTGGLTKVSIKLRENIPIEAEIAARVFLPFFEFPQPFDIDITIGIDGTITGTISGDVTLDRPGFATFKITSLTVGVEGGVVFTALSGSLTPKIQDLAWPTFDVKEIRVDSNGNVSVGGGWIDLPTQKTLDFHAFLIEITKIGFGTEDDGHRWIGFSGGVKIADGVKAGASVKGLRIIWKPGESPDLSLEGVSVELDIPNAISLKGSVALTGTELSGAVTVTVKPASLTIEGQFVSGSLPTGEKFFAILLRGELPAGIPLAATGLAIYGFSGMYAQNMKPGKTDQEDWYQNPDDSPGWYLRGPKVGVGELDKWTGAAGAFAFGAGVTLGTFSDNGYEFSGRLLLVLTFPGPMILIDGRANLFKKRTELDGDNPTFRAFAVIDPANSVLIDLDARYKYDSDGSLADLGGSAEAFFDFKNADNWHIRLGSKDDPGRRAGGTIFKLFNVTGYFELTPQHAAFGSGWSFEKKWTFHSLGVHLGASFSTDAVISWHPNHFSGSARFTGVAEATAFGRGAGITVDTTLTGDVFNPMHLTGHFFAGISLPWPLPDIGVTVTLEWKEELTAPPPLPLPLREVTVEHHKRMLKWPVRRGEALLPDNDSSSDLEFPADRPIGTPPGALEPVPAQAPRVPADSRIGLTFSRPVDDPSKIGDNPTLIQPEYIGDPSKRKGAFTVQYTLASVALEKRAPAPPVNNPAPQWTEIARAEGAVDQTGSFKITGSWVPVPPDDAHPEAATDQLKLFINAKTPFEYTSQTQQVWDNWVETRPSDYPCQPPALDPNQKFCGSFVDLQPPLPASPKNVDLVNPAFKVAWPDAAELVTSSKAVPGTTSFQTLGVAGVEGSGNEVRVVPPKGTNDVQITTGVTFQMATLVGTDVQTGQVNGNTLTMDSVVLSRFTANHAADADVPGPNPGIGKNPSNVTFQPDGSMEGRHLTEITFPPASSALSVEIETRFTQTFEGDGTETVAQIIVYREDGSRQVIQPFVEPEFEPHFPEVHKIRGGRITRVAIYAGDIFISLIYKVHARLPVSAIASSSDGTRTFGPFQEVVTDEAGVIDVKGEDIGLVKVSTQRRCEFTLAELCVPDRRLDLTRHTFTSLQRLTQDDEMFEPQADYRLVVATRRGDHTTGSGNSDDDAQIVNTNPDPRFIEQAYFRVVGPPGVEVPDLPVLPAGAQSSETGLEDLRVYLKATVPVSEPQVAGKPAARAHYRAYDVAMLFNEPSVVEKMYRLARRDLTLRLFDATNAPVLDADGRAIIPTTLWDREQAPTITEATSRWIRMVNGAGCRPSDIPAFDETTILGDQKIAGPAELLMAPETLYQARLVPALLHETFINAIDGLEANGVFELERWKSENLEAQSPKWVIVPGPALGPDGQPILDPSGNPVQIFFATEQLNREATLLYRGPLAAPSNLDSPAQWTDFRGSVQMRFPTGTVGVDLRRTASGDRLRIAFDRSAGTREIMALVGGNKVFSRTDPVDLGPPTGDVVVSFECVGSTIRVTQANTAPVQETLPPEAPTAGAIGLYANHAKDCLFTEVRVDDLRTNPSTAQRLDFVSSKYSNFAHHLGSHDDQVFQPETGLGIVASDLTAHLADAVPILFSSLALGLPDVTDAERRVFDDLEKQILGADNVLRTPERVEIIGASHDQTLTAVLIRSPEPFRWERTVLALSDTTESAFLGIPGDVKLVNVSYGPTPATEYVVLLIRNRVDLSGFSIEWRPMPDPNNPDPPWQPYYSFGNGPAFADGTQVFVFSGAAADAPAREPATVQRFVAPDPSQAQLHFVPPGIELRVLSATGAVVHHRAFNNTIAFTGQDAKAFRKLDGTGLILFRDPPPPNGPPRNNLVRLSFKLTRNLGDDFPIMRQAGSDTPEMVVTDMDLS